MARGVAAGALGVQDAPAVGDLVDLIEEPARPKARRQRGAARRTLHHLVAGAVAGATAKTVEAPIDRVKIMFQASLSVFHKPTKILDTVMTPCPGVPQVTKEKFTFRAAAKRLVTIAKTEGVQGLWKGNGAPRSPFPAPFPCFCGLRWLICGCSPRSVFRLVAWE